MTVVVWDGSTLATDCAATDGRVKWQSTKAWRFEDKILSGVGPLQSILAMRDWYMDGADPGRFPVIQTSFPCHFIVISRGQGLSRYESGPIPIIHGRNQCAFGEGRDFAYGAMAMGASAGEAVDIANQFSVHCGHGKQVYDLED